MAARSRPVVVATVLLLACVACDTFCSVAASNARTQRDMRSTGFTVEDDDDDYVVGSSASEVPTRKPSVLVVDDEDDFDYFQSRSTPPQGKKDQRAVPPHSTLQQGAPPQGKKDQGAVPPQSTSQQGRTAVPGGNYGKPPSPREMFGAFALVLLMAAAAGVWLARWRKRRASLELRKQALAALARVAGVEASQDRPLRAGQDSCDARGKLQSDSSVIAWLHEVRCRLFRPLAV